MEWGELTGEEKSEDKKTEITAPTTEAKAAPPELEKKEEVKEEPATDKPNQTTPAEAAGGDEDWLNWS